MGVNVDPPIMIGDAGSGGRAGLVPAPTTGDASKFLRGDATYQTIGGGGDLLAANNLSDVASASTALSNLGGAAAASFIAGAGALTGPAAPLTIGTAAGAATGDFATAAQGGKADTAVQPSTSPQLTSIELGHATDTTLARVSAGVASIEGNNILVSGGDAGTPSALVGTNISAMPYTALANGTDGELITWDAAGAVAAVAVGTAGHVLTSNGVGAAPTFQAGGGGGATTALDNLASVAINTDLLPDTDVTHDLGNATFQWSNIYQDDSTATEGILFKNNARFLHNFGDVENTFLGVDSGNFTMSGATYNVGVGHDTLRALTSGDNNVAIGGLDCGDSITSGSQNVMIGSYAGAGISTVEDSVSIGYSAGSTNVGGRVCIGRSTSAGTNSTVVGTHAGDSSSATESVFLGYRAGYNQDGTNNIAIGKETMYNASGTGTYNIAIGTHSLKDITSGESNVAIGKSALENLTTGGFNVAIGDNAGEFQANGSTVLATPEDSVYIGKNARGLNDSDDNSVVIGGEGASGPAIGEGANTTVIGNSDTTSFHAFGRMQGNQGTDAASATNLTLAGDGNVFELTGTTKVDLISNLSWEEGSTVILVANESVDIDHGTATSTTNITILLAGSIDYSMTAGDTLMLCLCSTTAGGQAWREISRTVI